MIEHNPKTHKHFNISIKVGERMQIWRCLEDGCKYKEERPIVIPIVLGLTIGKARKS